MQPAEHLHQLRIAPAPLGLLLHDLEGCFGLHGFLIRTCTRQGIVDVGHLHDPGQQRNPVALEAIRIAGTVPPFVMAANDR